jgi:nucleotide-binding universal stress UspA family protein
VIVVPFIRAAATIGERVLVAWDGGREAARAVNDALPILERAKSVTVLSVNPASEDGSRREPGADISLHLARHGVKVEAQRRITTEISAGDAILNEIASKGSDLLVMGAYGHSRLRELVLGGVTRQILGSMTVPVLMSH